MPFPNIYGRPPLFQTVEQLEGLIEKYFESCFGLDANGNRIQIRPITIEGLAYDLGCNRKTVREYKGKTDVNGKEFFPIIQRAIDRCQVSLIEHALTAKNPAGAIWLGCNNFDYVNKTDIHVVPEQPPISPSEIKAILDEKKGNRKVLEIGDNREKAEG